MGVSGVTNRQIRTMACWFLAADALISAIGHLSRGEVGYTVLGVAMLVFSVPLFIFAAFAREA